MEQTTQERMKNSNDLLYAMLVAVKTRVVLRQCLKSSLIIGVFVVLSSIIYGFILTFKHKNFSATINGKDAEGWKLIPFNERFDTQVDDQVIAHDTLNGKMIDGYVTDLSDLKSTIMNALNDTSPLKGRKKKGPTYLSIRQNYPLSRLLDACVFTF